VPGNSIKNFLSKNIHDSTLDSILLVSARVSDDADYDVIMQSAVATAIKPFTTWMNDSNMKHTITMTWGESWIPEQNIYAGQLFINVTAKASLASPGWAKEDMMMFKLKFSDMLPLTDISEYIVEASEKY